MALSDYELKQMEKEKLEFKRSATLWYSIIFLSLFIIISLMAGCPRYNVWKQELSGKADLKKAQWTRKIAIQEAMAKKESAKELAAAEVIRAHGVAESNKIIGSSLKDNDAYLRYLWIQALSENDNDVIYVPTEANLPILEATRLNKLD